VRAEGFLMSLNTTRDFLSIYSKGGRMNEELKTMHEMLEEHKNARKWPGRIEEVTADLVKETQNLVKATHGIVSKTQNQVIATWALVIATWALVIGTLLVPYLIK
jgi:hypothetical protein